MAENKTQKQYDDYTGISLARWVVVGVVVIVLALALYSFITGTTYISF